MFKILMICVMFLFTMGCSGESKNESITKGIVKTELLPATAYKDIVPNIGTTPMLLEFGASSCAACITMGKILAQIKAEYPKSAIYFIEVYADMPVARNYQIQMIPTQIYLDAKGNEIERHMGEIGYAQLVANLKSKNIIKE
ncbi:MAG: thioredoxin family protein [Sulfurospirillaceae bacterium]|nr:thioredoxin family protein [Sulfurospirillaceae bacterium]MDD3462578.1 thioredoxin family protein [Sulfurospirillaceae bacterium]